MFSLSFLYKIRYIGSGCIFSGRRWNKLQKSDKCEHNEKSGNNFLHPILHARLNLFHIICNINDRVQTPDVRI